MPTRFIARKAGFTLVELLVVVAILSAVALASFGLMTENRAQVRIDDTRNRLAILRRAIIGPESPVYGGEMRLAGYVADNGRLPGTLAELLFPPTDHMPQGGVEARFLGAGADCTVSLASGASVGHVAARVLKGHRGNYLAGVAHNNEFRDGWGNVEAAGGGSAENFGWGWDTVDNALTITSYGADNAPDTALTPPGTPTEEAEADQTMSIAGADWRVPLDGWRVTLKNAGAAGSGNLGSSDFSGTPGGGDLDKLGLVLLVFENETGGRWRQYRSDQNNCPDELEPEGSCVLGFTSAALTSCGDAVPLGRHVLALTRDNGAELADGALGRIAAQVDFFPGAHPPNLVWALHK